MPAKMPINIELNLDLAQDWKALLTRTGETRPAWIARMVAQDKATLDAQGKKEEE